MTDQARHTPGPWWVDETFTIWTGGLAIAYADGSHVAHTTRGFEGPDGEAYANARLIAAAPDLLEALKDVLSIIRTVCPEYEEATMCANARAAIFAVEGDT